MTLLSGLSTLSELVGSGVGVWLVTELVKKAPQIPINEGNKTALRATAGACSALGVVLLGFANSNLQPQDLQTAIQALIGVGIAWATAHATHKVVN